MKKEVMMSKYRIWLLSATLFSSVFTYAQTEEPSSIHGQVNIETAASRPVERVQKPTDKPTPKDTAINAPEMKYSNLPGTAVVNYRPEDIAPVKMIAKPVLEKLYRGYVKGGIGNYTTPYAELWFTDLYNKKGTYGVRALHQSSQGGMKNVGFNGYSDNQVGLFVKRFWKKNEIGGALDYNRNVLHYYGFNPDSFEVAKADIRRSFNYIGAKGWVGTYDPDSAKINHREELEYYYFADNHKASEHSFQLSTELGKRVNKEVIGGTAFVRYNNFTPTFLFPSCESCLTDPEQDYNQQNIIFSLNPTIRSFGKNWTGKAGLRIMADIYGKVSYFRFYPDVEFRYSLFNDIFVPYLGINGGIDRNSFYTLAQQNPFVLPDIQLQGDVRNTNNKINIYGGFRGTISSRISFNLEAGFKKVEDEAFFVNDTVYSVENRFGVIYDNLDIVSFTGELNWRVEEKIKVLLKGEGFLYSILNEEKPWGMPNFRIMASGVYDLYDKIMARLDVFVVGTRWGRSLVPVEGIYPIVGVYPVEMKPFVDLNLSLEYRYTKRLSAFFNLNNIAGKKYQYWYKYPVQGINILGGVTYSF